MKKIVTRQIFFGIEPSTLAVSENCWKADAALGRNLDSFLYSFSGDSAVETVSSASAGKWGLRTETISLANRLNTGKTTSKFGFALLLLNMILGNNFSSRPIRLISDEEIWNSVQSFNNLSSPENELSEIIRISKIKSVHGKYSAIDASSEEFVANKRAEIHLEA